jgi:hypothetical protein
MSDQAEQFDWNSTALTVDNCGDKFGDPPTELMGVLGLLRVDYFLPLLSEVGLPDYLIQHPQVFRSVFDEFVPLYEEAIDEFDKWSYDVDSNYRSRIIKEYELNPALDRAELYNHLDLHLRAEKVVRFNVRWRAWRDILVMFAAKAGEEVARELESWVYYYYFSEKFDDAIFEWWIVLTQTDEIPICLAGMVDLIEELNTDDASDRFYTKVRQAYDRFFEEDKNKRQTSYLTPGWVLERAWRKTRTIPILQEFASRLHPEELEIVKEWAIEYANMRILGRPEKLYADELITTKVLFSDLPSVFDVTSY